MEAGKFNTVVGNLPPNSKLGDGNTIVNAADKNGNVILNTPMAVGYGARAGKDSISIGAFAGGGIDSPEINSVLNSATNPPDKKPPENIKTKKHDTLWQRPIGSVWVAVVGGVIVLMVGYIFRHYLGIPL